MFLPLAVLQRHMLFLGPDVLQWRVLSCRAVLQRDVLSYRAEVLWEHVYCK
jgi:hypothetical protein